MSRTRLIAAACLGLNAIASVGCTTSLPVNALSLTGVVGSALAGTQGKTVTDQGRIDETVARLCGSGVYGADLCAKQTAATKARRDELRAGK